MRTDKTGKGRTKFNRFKDISPYEPMAETLFFAYVKEHKPETFRKAIIGYLAQFGFRNEYHYIPYEQCHIHKTVFNHFWYGYYMGLKGAR